MCLCEQFLRTPAWFARVRSTELLTQFRYDRECANQSAGNTKISPLLRPAHSAIYTNSLRFKRTRLGRTNLYCFKRRYPSFPPSLRHRCQPLYSSPTWLEPVRRGPGLRCCMWRTKAVVVICKGGERKRRCDGGGGYGESRIIDLIFFFSTN